MEMGLANPERASRNAGVFRTVQVQDAKEVREQREIGIPRELSWREQRVLGIVNTLGKVCVCRVYDVAITLSGSSA